MGVIQKPITAVLISHTRAFALLSTFYYSLLENCFACMTSGGISKSGRAPECVQGSMFACPLSFVTFLWGSKEK
jgi:hypothetical protein